MSKCVCNGERYLGIVGQELAGFSKTITAYVQGNNLRIFGEAPEDPAGDIQIKYCPLCGKKLTKNIMPAYDPEAASQRSSVRYA